MTDIHDWVQSWQLDHTWDQFDAANMIHKLEYTNRSPFEMIGCNISFVKGSWNIGSKLPNGSYNGMIGLMVNGIANSTALAYLLGSTDDEPVVVGPVWTSTEMAILSAKSESENVSLIGPQQWIYNFDSSVYLYQAICIMLFIVCFIILSLFYEIIHKRRVKSRINIWRIRRQIVTTAKMLIVKCTTCLIRTETFPNPTDVHRPLTFGVSVTLFFLIQGIFLNLTSTDLIAEKPVPIIDDVKDFLYNPYFEEVSGAIPGGLWQEAILKGALEGSVEYMLYQRVNEVMDIQLNEPGDMMKTIGNGMDKLMSGKSVLIADKSIMLICRSTLCQIKGHANGSRTHVSRGPTFGERLITFAISKSSDESLVDWINYRQTLLHQSGLTRDWTYKAAFNMIIIRSFTMQQLVDCLEPVQEDQPIPDQVQLQFFASALLLMSYIVLVAGLALAIEIISAKLLLLICI